MKIIRQICLIALCAPALLLAQVSTGADGPYNPAASGDFDPALLNINAAGDNVFNFTTINIPAGVTIKLRASKLRNQAVTWLASGTVTIAGVLDLSGATAATLDTTQAALLASNRLITEPGPGGYPGGLGARGGLPPETGAGPGGGPAGALTTTNPGYGPCQGGSGSFLTTGQVYINSLTGTPYGSYFLVPLYGGSGGGGGYGNAAANTGGIGGAGGGAIRIASSNSISVTGSILAVGGNGGLVTGPTAGCPGGVGAGGAIHLVAPTLLGNGGLSVRAGFNPLLGTPPPNGIIRFSTTTNNFTGGTFGYVPILGPFYLPPPNSALSSPSIRITQVNGVAVPSAPGGQYLYPDVVVSAAGAVTINIAGVNIPLGTVVNLRLTAESGSDQVVTCSALAGTVPASTATCNATLPFSISIAAIRASW